MVEGADQDSKTEEPTSKRISESRDEGNIPMSREMSAWFLFVSLLMVIQWFGPSLAAQMKDGLQVFIEKPEQISIEDGGLQNVLMGVISSVALPAIMVFGIMLVLAILGTMIQTGFYVGTGRLKMKIENLSPAKGMQKLFSMNAVSELVKSFFKLVVLGYVCFVVLSPVYRKLPNIAQLGLLSGIDFLHREAAHLLIILLLVITVIAVADLLYVRYQYFKGLRMTKQEVKDEHKQMEGDPIVKNRIRAMRIEKARRRMMAKVPNASVIITNPTHYAVALQYDRDKMAAPVLVAKGVDRVALRIREVGEESEVPVISNPPLARALYDNVDLDEPIQPEHYRAVAEIISYVYKMKNS
ncbi:MAG: flagellar biosynthesis protein FlhB [Alphaproteobacteria bacterium]|nr:flagellar biosynthesis protein FlhB [Alphaproteobacteria bacterium]